MSIKVTFLFAIIKEEVRIFTNSWKKVKATVASQVR